MGSSRKARSYEARYLDASALTRDEMIRLTNSPSDRMAYTIPLSKVTTEDTLKVQPMTFWGHLACVAFLGCGVPHGVFIVPGLTYFVGRCIGNVPLAFQVLALLLTPLAILPQAFIPSTLHSWLANQVIKYFSFRFIMEEPPPSMSKGDDNAKQNAKNTPQILVAPPHGVFPYGNILSMLVWPCMTGNHFHGLAANSALRVPGFKQILTSIGAVDASRESARRALEHYPYTIGISTGGVAEVFETGTIDECILLKERIGLIKLAIRTGADLVPCYLFGNNKLFSCWPGFGIPALKRVLERISRKIGFALVLYSGRLGLPVPKRVPILAILGRPIPTAHIKCEEPTADQITDIQGKLLEDMQVLFDKYKGIYGWQKKRLVIK